MPTTPARSITASGTGLPRTFSTIAQKMCPPSSGRNGNRLMMASDSEISARMATTWPKSTRIVWRVTS